MQDELPGGARATGARGARRDQRQLGRPAGGDGPSIARCDAQAGLTYVKSPSVCISMHWQTVARMSRRLAALSAVVMAQTQVMAFTILAWRLGPHLCTPAHLAHPGTMRALLYLAAALEDLSMAGLRPGGAASHASDYATCRRLHIFVQVRQLIGSSAGGNLLLSPSRFLCRGSNAGAAPEPH